MGGLKKKTGAKNNSSVPFTIHQIRETSAWPVWWNNRNTTPLKIISIDPGITHFCLRVEERLGTDTLKTLQFIKTNIGDRSKLKKKGVSNNMEQNGLLGDCCVAQHVDERYAVAFNEPFRVYGRLTRLLDEIDLSGVHVVVVESQMLINYKMTRLGQHIIGYFIQRSLREQLTPLIVEVEPRLKTMHLKPKPLDVKKWAVENAREIASRRGDIEGLKLLEQKGKVNDFADTLVQVEYFFAYCKLCSGTLRA
jgi:hypothetical protein